MEKRSVILWLALAIGIGSLVIVRVARHLKAMPTGCPTLEWAGSSGGGVGQNCDCSTVMQDKDKFEVEQSGYFSAEYSCMPTGYDSTFKPVNCATVTAKVGAVSTETSTQYYKLCAPDCNWHYMTISTTVTCEGIITNYHGEEFAMECSHDSHGHVCPGT
ncbi:MAG TPA: hypothetical protein VI455_11315 [Terriglobia bacterium]